jgi:hypothetical protein
VRLAGPTAVELGLNVSFAKGQTGRTSIDNGTDTFTV